MAGRLGLSADSGLFVLRVVEGRPADLAGVLRRDVLTEANGTLLRSRDDLVQAVQTAGLGGTVVLTMLRSGTELPLAVVVGEQPPYVQNAPRRPETGKALPRSLGKVNATVIDEEGNVVTFNVVAGAVTAISSDALTVQSSLGGLAADDLYERRGGLDRLPAGRP
ncbi:MAG: PDZ domain-containing protein [Dehalococcoidia bacterium]|nr:PDZ domain-containing protein [Dehalococcoidia bacterium]